MHTELQTVVEKTVKKNQRRRMKVMIVILMLGLKVLIEEWHRR
jgi:hypothetical protein